MDIFSVLSLLGGVAFFLYGMTVMSSGLERMAGGKLERMLKKMTSKPFAALALGAGITIAIQSSSAVTVMLVGLVNSGIMSLGQTVGVIMGSNIGTTLTTWLLAMIGIESESVFLKMLKPENFSLLFALVGAVLIMNSKNQKKKDVGSILLGFAVLMFGMNLMSDAVAPLADSPEFSSMMTAFNNPLLAVLVGAIFTGIIQSSAASVGILQALAMTGGVSYGMAIPIIMGQNIGTCATALISSIGVSRNAKKVAVIHVSFNVIGTVVCLSAFYLVDAFANFAFVDTPIGTMGIAVIHTIFNVVTTALLIPFMKKLEALANRILPDKKTKEDKKTGTVLDTRLLATPSVAISECNEVTVEMATLAEKSLFASFDTIGNYSEKVADALIEAEEEIDGYEDRLGTYLVSLSSKSLSSSDSRKVSKMLHVIGDFERLGDHAVNILKTSKELCDKGLSFSEKATEEIGTLITALKDIVETAIGAYKSGSVETAKRVEPLEQVIDGLVSEVKERHIERLQRNNCTIEMGFVLSDLLNNFERISDHCSNIAVTIIELSHDTLDTHKYLNNVKYGNPRFRELFDEYEAKYALK